MRGWLIEGEENVSVGRWEELEEKRYFLLEWIDKGIESSKGS